MEQQSMTRRQKRLLKKEEKVRVQEKQVRGMKISAGRVIGILLFIGIAAAAVYSMVRSSGSNNGGSDVLSVAYTDTPVHWHGTFEIELCGVKQDFSSYGSGGHHAGLPLFHTHGDGMIHIEGRVIKKEDIALGIFFDSINTPFGQDKIMDKKSGDMCPNTPDKPGSVKMFVNDVQNDQFRDFVGNYTPNGQDTRIRVVFD